MKSVFDKSRTTFEKFFLTLIILIVIASVIASNINLDIFVYAGFGSYVILGLLAYFKPGLVFESIKRENEQYLVRNQRKIPLIKAGIRYGGLATSILGLVLNYIFIAFY